MVDMFYYTGVNCSSFKLNIKNISISTFLLIPAHLQYRFFTTINSTTTIYAKDSDVVTFIKTKTGVPAGVTVINCSTTTCP